MAISLVLLPAFSLCASAQEPTKHFEVFAEVGVSSVTEASRVGVVVLPPIPGLPATLPFASRTSFSTSVGLFTGGRFYIRRKHALEVSYSYTETEFLRRTDFPTAVVFTILPLEVQGVAFNYVVYIFPRGRLRTFATGGLGFTVYDGGPDFKRTRFTGNFGGGLDIRLHGPLSARLEIRDFLSKRLRLSSTLDPDGIANNLVASAGLAVRF